MEIPPGLIDSAAILRTQGTTDVIHRGFRAGRLVRIRRGFYVRTADWLGARPSERFAWSTAAVARSVKGAVLCGETAALAAGLPTLRTPACVELATTLPGRSGVRRSLLTVLGEDAAAQQVRGKRSYPLKYCLRPASETVVRGEFRCTSPVQTTLDLMVSGRFSEALVVADGLARMMHHGGVLPAEDDLMAVPAIAAGISATPTRPRDTVQYVWRPSPARWPSPSVSPTAGPPLSSLDSSSPYCSMCFGTRKASLAGWTAGGRGSGLWASSTARQSTLMQLSVVVPHRRRRFTGRSSAKTGSAPSGLASCGGAGRMWSSRSGCGGNSLRPGCGHVSRASSRIRTLKARIREQAWEWANPQAMANTHAGDNLWVFTNCSITLWCAS